ncbi:hypothetical protein N7462_005701 [Penicillium macrosclerotiorum]|uniref:uncharacterized protein n=1 Tax=Penicillium macrosclerotiorum TaxID=303699 RepID=UPI002546B9D8|nr:uncharacterized protein N7462_005701 [Penicillium macrosclerotiorum]KAJ5682536.1 hypothetical protein N7462_005701 [Penicillium macrosclerotiorum]
MRREYLPLGSLPAWLRLNGVTTNGVAVQGIGSPGKETDKGNSIVATDVKTSKESDTSPEVLLRVPSDLVLSLDTVHDHSKSDRHLHDVLEAVGDFGRTTRGAIMIFLLVQLTHSCPDTPKYIGISNPWTEYIKFLPPSIPLPTSFSAEELQLLRGTSLAAAVEAKTGSLEREFEHLRQSTEGVAWCQQCWWAEGTEMLSMDDWKYIDAAYRSRMLDVPGRGLAMVPCIDMANHGAGSDAKALYDTDAQGNVVLQLRWGQNLQLGEEVTISYGDEKSASEMIFSYGFLESDRTETNQAVLDMSLPDDDPLGVAKNMFCRTTPGIRLSTVNNETNQSMEALPKSLRVTWESPLAWWASVNEEDGLHMGVTETVDGARELEAIWKGEKIQSPHRLQELLAADPLWDIFQLRAVVLVSQRLEAQLALLHEIEGVLSDPYVIQELHETVCRPEIFNLISRLRELESELLQKAIGGLTEQRDHLLESKTVSAYLAQQSHEEEEEEEVAEDFS